MHSVAAEEASAPTEEELGGSISEQERAQYERWAAEVAVRTPFSSPQSERAAAWHAMFCLR